MSRARVCVDMPRHLLKGTLQSRPTWENVIRAVLGVAPAGLWVTALVMLV